MRKPKEPPGGFAKRRNCDRHCAGKSKYLKQGPARPYKSQFGRLWLTPAEYLAEGMCARLARRDKVEVGCGFFLDEPWWSEFQVQVTHASGWLEHYAIAAVIAALRTARGKQFYSLGAFEQLRPLVKYEQGKLDARRAANAAKAEAEPKPPEPETPATTVRPRPPFVQNNILSKLRGL